MRILCGLLFIFAFPAFPVAKAKEKAAPETIPFPQQESDLKADPAPAEISALAAKYLGRERASRATILPAPKEKQ